MAVNEKELIIDGKAVRSPEQQVYKNMKDIQALQLKIKEAYKCAGELNTASISVAKSLTNAGEDVKEGWLLDTVGNLFSITGGDENSLLLDFYCSIRGPQGDTGPSGAEVQIDDTETALDKTWSSDKISRKIDLISDKGIYYTTVQPTLDDDVYTLNVSDLGNNNTYTWQKYGDLVIYIDGNGNPTELWKCVGLNGTHEVMTVEKVADYAKGKQLYQHFVKIAINNPSSGSNLVDTPLYILNDNSEPMTFNDILSYLQTKGFINNLNVYPYITYVYNSSAISVGLFNDNGTLKVALTNMNSASQTTIPNTTPITDTVVPL